MREEKLVCTPSSCLSGGAPLWARIGTIPQDRSRRIRWSRVPSRGRLVGASLPCSPHMPSNRIPLDGGRTCTSTLPRPLRWLRRASRNPAMSSRTAGGRRSRRECGRQTRASRHLPAGNLFIEENALYNRWCMTLEPIRT